jgi:hypothetical protein
VSRQVNLLKMPVVIGAVASLSIGLTVGLRALPADVPTVVHPFLVPPGPINASESRPELGKPGEDVPLALLAKQGILPTREGITTFLRQLHHDPKTAEKVQKWIAQLGDADFRTREAATRALLELSPVPIRELERASNSPDPERAVRARRILADPRIQARQEEANLRPHLVLAVCHVIRAKPIPGVTSVLLETLPFLGSSREVYAAQEALMATVRAEDGPVLRKALESENVTVKAAALRGLARVDKDPVPQLRSLLRDGQPGVVLAAAHALAERGDRAALPVLIDLLQADQETIRARSVQILRAWTGQRFTLDPFEDPASQKEQRARWSGWLAREGNTARLHHPLSLTPLPEDLDQGLLLHYTFDQDIKGRTDDHSGRFHHGKVYHAHQYVAGKAGKALFLRGAGYGGPGGGHVLLPVLDFPSRKEFTLALWVKEQGMSNTEGEAYVVFGADRGVGIEDSLGISHFNNSIFYRVGEGSIAVDFDNKDRNRWVHYALTFRDGRLRGYKDGKQVGEVPARVSIVGKHAALGRHWWHHGEATSTRFIGALDDVRIYDRALSPSQIQRLVRSAKK